MGTYGGNKDHFILLTLHASRPHRRCVPAPRVCAHDGEGLLQQVVLEEDVIRVADVSCVGVEVVGGDAVPGWFHAAVGGDWGVDALGPLGGGGGAIQ